MPIRFHFNLDSLRRLYESFKANPYDGLIFALVVILCCVALVAVVRFVRKK